MCSSCRWDSFRASLGIQIFWDVVWRKKVQMGHNVLEKMEWEEGSR